MRLLHKLDYYMGYIITKRWSTHCDWQMILWLQIVTLWEWLGKYSHQQITASRLHTKSVRKISWHSYHREHGLGSTYISDISAKQLNLCLWADINGSYSRCRGLVCSVWLWYFLTILTYFFLFFRFPSQEFGFRMDTTFAGIWLARSTNEVAWLHTKLWYALNWSMQHQFGTPILQLRFNK